MSVSKKGLIMAGAVLALLGAIAIAVPIFTTSETKDLVKVGDVKITSKEETSHTIPPMVGWAGLAIGAVMMGAGLLRQS